MHRLVLSALSAFALLAGATGDIAAQEKRIALVIGNSAYQHTPKLANPRNDAADIAAALKALGFSVIEGLDLDKPSMERAIKDFAERLGGADLGLFFFAGHGLQVSGQNYLVPVDARLSSAAALDFEMIRLDLVQRAMERESKSNIIFLDACRDNPLARNLARAMGTRSIEVGRGLALAESGVGTLISFSTQPGNVALDGDGRNSPFAAALVRHIPTRGEDIGSILIRVRNDVMDATKNRQVPWEHSALRSRLYLASAATAMPAAQPAPAPAAGPTARAGGTASGFNGVWEVTITGGRFCPVHTVTYPIVIKGGAVLSSRPRPGTLEPDGTIRFSQHGRTGENVVVQYEGKMANGAGEGTYVAEGTQCSGTFTMKRKDSATATR